MAKKGNTSNAKGANAGKPEQAAINRTKALDLRIRGRSYQGIADALGVSKPTAYKYVCDALDELADVQEEKAERLRELEVRRLDDTIEHVRKVIEDENIDHDTRMKAADRIIKLSESRRKLLGLDAPDRQDLTTDGKAITFNIVEAKRDDNG